LLIVSFEGFFEESRILCEGASHHIYLVTWDICRKILNRIIYANIHESEKGEMRKPEPKRLADIGED